MNEPYHDYIAINTQSIMDDGEYTQDIELPDGTFEFTFKWNPIDRTYTVDIADDQGDIYDGEVMQLYVPLWRGNSNPRLPSETLIPMTNDYDKQIDKYNLNQTVFLCIDDLTKEDDNDGFTA